MAILKTPYSGENILTTLSFEDTGTEPLTKADIKDWGKIETSDDDSLIDELITGVIDYVERTYQIPIIQKKVTAYYEQYSEAITLPYAPVKKVNTIKRLDEGEENDIADSDWRLTGDVLYIFEQYTAESPWWRQGLKLVYTVGWDTLPPGIKTGLKKAILSHYNDREDNVGGMNVQTLPNSSAAILSQYRNY